MGSRKSRGALFKHCSIQLKSTYYLFTFNNTIVWNSYTNLKFSLKIEGFLIVYNCI